MGMGIHDVSFGDEGHRIGQMLSQATKVIKSRGSTGAERDLFFTSFRGFDSHAGSDPAVRKEGSTISPFDHSINRFKQEMEAEGLWGDVTVLAMSEFGRTMESNSRGGTDHGWGGNNMIFGGGLKGKRIFGKYPASDKGVLGAGRVIPTTSLEAIWQPILQWIGLSEPQIDSTLPNRAN